MISQNLNISVSQLKFLLWKLKFLCFDMRSLKMGKAQYYHIHKSSQGVWRDDKVLEFESGRVFLVKTWDSQDFTRLPRPIKYNFEGISSNPKKKNHIRKRTFVQMLQEEAFIGPASSAGWYPNLFCQLGAGELLPSVCKPWTCFVLKFSAWQMFLDRKCLPFLMLKWPITVWRISKFLTGENHQQFFRL